MDKSWLYENDFDNKVRYVLGLKGKRPLFCFGINPSTAVPDRLDNTLKSVERHSISNGYDSWIMLNVYPQRATNPKDLHPEINNEVHKRNLVAMERIFSCSPSPVIWAAWGTIIEIRPYLFPCLMDICNIAAKYNPKWVTLGNRSKIGHPHHPLYLRNGAGLELFDIKKYIENCR